MLRMTRRFDTGDPKDKVYALLGMVDFNLKSDTDKYTEGLGVIERVPKEIPINYSKDFTPADLYYEVAKFFLQSDNNLEILSSREHIEPWEELPWPSWVPRWDVREKPQQIWIRGATAGDNFAANSDLDPSILLERKYVGGTVFRTCRVRGVEVDCLETHYFCPMVGGWNELVNTIGQIVEEDQEKRPFSSKLGIVAELAMALTAGRNGRGSVIPTTVVGSASTSQYAHIDDFMSFILDLADYAADNDAYRFAETSFTLLVTHIKAIGHNARDSKGLESSYAVRCQEALRNRSIFRTSSGQLVVGQSVAKIGDQVVVLQGGRVPFILRKLDAGSIEESAGTHQLVGECYCYGLMKGESNPKMRTSCRSITLV